MVVCESTTKEAVFIWVCITGMTSRTTQTHCLCHCAWQPRQSKVKKGKVLYEKSKIQKKKMTCGPHTKEPIRTTVLATRTTTKDQKVFCASG